MTLLKNQIYLRNDKGVEVQSDCADVIACLEYNATFFPASLVINLSSLSLNSKCFEYLRNHESSIYSPYTLKMCTWKCPNHLTLEKVKVGREDIQDNDQNICQHQ